MNIQQVPPPPKETYYQVTLTKDQLICLGILSFKYETTRDLGGTHRFHALLPPEIRKDIENWRQIYPVAPDFPQGIWDK